MARARDADSLAPCPVTHRTGEGRAASICGAMVGFGTWVATPCAVAKGMRDTPPNIRVTSTAAAAEREGSGKPEKAVSTFKGSVVIPADSLWNSPVRFDEQCPFDLAIEFDETFTDLVFGDDYEILQIEIGDRYTNLATGFTFVDRARYSIRLDMSTGLAAHRGTFWQVNVDGGGIEVHDAGDFVQDWSTIPPPLAPVVERHGTFDVNVLPFGTLSYCDWAQGVFP